MDAYIATILPVGFSHAPADWSLCLGQPLSVAQYSAVYSLIGNLYGGDYATFRLPDMRGRMPIGNGQSPASSLIYSIGNNGGRDAVTLNVGQMPAHTHIATFKPGEKATVKIPAKTGSQTATLKANSTVGTLQNALTGSALAGSSASSTKIYAASAASQVSLDKTSITIEGDAPTAAQSILTDAITGGEVTNSVMGAGLPFDARPPYLAINFIFCMQGLYPVKS